MELDPFIYDIPSETKDHPGSEPTRYKTWENKGKDIDFQHKKNKKAFKGFF